MSYVWNIWKRRNRKMFSSTNPIWALHDDKIMNPFVFQLLGGCDPSHTFKIRYRLLFKTNSHYMDCSKWTTPAPSTNTSAFTISTLCVSEEYFLGPYFLGTVCVLAICLPSVLIDQRRFKCEILWNFLAWRVSTRRSKKGRYIKIWKTDAVGIAAQKVQSNKTSS